MNEIKEKSPVVTMLDPKSLLDMNEAKEKSLVLTKK
jgi:hypothetical protein